MYTKRAPEDINIYAMNDINTTQELSKIEKKRLANRLSYRRNKDKRTVYNRKYYQENRENCIKASLLRYDPEHSYALYKARQSKLSADEKKQKSEERKLRYSLRSPEEIQKQKERDIIRKSNLSPEKIQQSKDYHKRRYRERKEAIAAYSKEHNKKEEVIQRRKERNKLRWVTDTNFKIAGILRDRLYRGLKSKGISKTISAIELVGCDIPTLKQHIEMQFLPGMSWDNYNHSTWHVDHIKPVNTFDLTDIEQQKICFHYTNLRPLWAKDNLSRPDNGSDIIDYHIIVICRE
jgi:hypothetical protein